MRELGLPAVPAPEEEDKTGLRLWEVGHHLCRDQGEAADGCEGHQAGEGQVHRGGGEF